MEQFHNIDNIIDKVEHERRKYLPYNALDGINFQKSCFKGGDDWFHLIASHVFSTLPVPNKDYFLHMEDMFSSKLDHHKSEDYGMAALNMFFEFDPKKAQDWMMLKVDFNEPDDISLASGWSICDNVLKYIPDEFLEFYDKIQRRNPGKPFSIRTLKYSRRDKFNEMIDLLHSSDDRIDRISAIMSSPGLLPERIDDFKRFCEEGVRSHDKGFAIAAIRVAGHLARYDVDGYFRILGSLERSLLNRLMQRVPSAIVESIVYSSSFLALEAPEEFYKFYERTTLTPLKNALAKNSGLLLVHDPHLHKRIWSETHKNGLFRRAELPMGIGLSLFDPDLAGVNINENRLIQHHFWSDNDRMFDSIQEKHGKICKLLQYKDLVKQRVRDILYKHGPLYWQCPFDRAPMDLQASFLDCCVMEFLGNMDPEWFLEKRHDSWERKYYGQYSLKEEDQLQVDRDYIESIRFLAPVPAYPMPELFQEQDIEFPLTKCVMRQDLPLINHYLSLLKEGRIDASTSEEDIVKNLIRIVRMKDISAEGIRYFG